MNHAAIITRKTANGILRNQRELHLAIIAIGLQYQSPDSTFNFNLDTPQKSQK